MSNERGNRPKLVIITGMSGAGRTEAIHVFEDMNYFCVDNLPAALLPNLLQVAESKNGIAVVCDTRNGEFFGCINTVIDDLEAKNVDFRILFLEASDDILVARYKFSRRRHPLCESGETILEGITQERNLLSHLKTKAHYVINTTSMLPGKLRTSIRELFSYDGNAGGLSVTVFSFGFKYGAPLDADLVMDVRFLPNPYWDEQLRDKTGLDAPVRDYVILRNETNEFIRSLQNLLDCVMPGYMKEGKQQLTIAIGCTGGRHRSVVIAELTGDYLKTKGYAASITHRDIDRQ